MIDPELIWTWIGSLPVHLWEKYESIIIEYREQYETPPKGMWFEDLTYAIRVERDKNRKGSKDRIARRMERREALGLPTY